MWNRLQAKFQRKTLKQYLLRKNLKLLRLLRKSAKSKRKLRNHLAVIVPPAFLIFPVYKRTKSQWNLNIKGAVPEETWLLLIKTKLSGKQSLLQNLSRKSPKSKVMKMKMKRCNQNQKRSLRSILHQDVEVAVLLFLVNRLNHPQKTCLQREE